jgi:hypothetical protein
LPPLASTSIIVFMMRIFAGVFIIVVGLIASVLARQKEVVVARKLLSNLSEKL